MGRKIPGKRSRGKLKPVDPFHPKNKRKSYYLGAAGGGAPDDAEQTFLLAEGVEQIATTNRKKRSAEAAEASVLRNRDQSETRWFREFQKSKKGISFKGRSAEKKPKFKKNKNDYEGYTRLPFESDYHFMHRVSRETRSYIHEQKLRIKYELTGNPSNPDPETSVRKAKPKKLDAKTHPDKAKSAAASRKEIDKREMLLDAREVIGFGERVDAPPVFSSQSLRHLTKKKRTGGTDVVRGLHLNRVIEENIKKRRTIVSAADRQAVIEAYRRQKNKRSTQNISD